LLFVGNSSAESSAHKERMQVEGMGRTYLQRTYELTAVRLVRHAVQLERLRDRTGLQVFDNFAGVLP
jgi:hypothetical protein